MPARTCGEGLVALRLAQVLEMVHVPARPAGRRWFSRVDQLLEDFPAIAAAHAAATANMNGPVTNSYWKLIHQEGQRAASVPASGCALRKISDRRTPIGTGAEAEEEG
eukprot:SAG22_NODE_546_length_9261_cov_18.423925_2_plen_108_part_00